MQKTFVAALLSCCASLAAAGPAEKIANAIPSCAWPDGMVPAAVSKLPDQFKVRAVQLPDGAAQVSVVEGYRFHIEPPGKEPFANVKIEQSQADKFESDRAAIVANIRWILSTSKGMESPEPLLVDLNGFEGPMINRAGFTGTTLALIALFHEKEKLVVTIYLENAPPEQRAFKTKDEWNAMRDRFFVAFTSCADKALVADAPASPAAPAPAATPAPAAPAPAAAETPSAAPAPAKP